MASNLILIIEDNRELREAMTQLLEMEGFSLASVANGKEAIDFLKNNNGAALPSLILLDMQMPVMNGEEFLSKLEMSDVLRNIPVIVASAALPADVFESLKLRRPKPVAIIRKPFDVSELIDLINEHANR